MFSENLKALRSAKGYSQEELASRLHVVRQTISKWEKGLSVPDADLLVKLADILETDISTLLGADVTKDEDPNQIAQQLGQIAEQMAIKNRRSKLILKTVIFILGVFLLLNILSLAASAVFSYSSDSPTVTTQQISP